MARLEPRRNRNGRALPPGRPPADGPLRGRLLIACEGSATEPIYFEALCRDLALAGDEVEVLGDESGSHPLSVVTCAQRRVKRVMRTLELDTSPYDSVWCVFDRDEHPRVKDALSRAASLGFEVAFSNPCFELWFLLHFAYSSAELSGREVRMRLAKFIPDYGKSQDVYDLLGPLQDTALTHAERLRAYHERAGDPLDRNPSTTVDRLVRELVALAEA